MTRTLKTALAAIGLAALATTGHAAEAFKLVSPDIAEGRQMAMTQVANVFGGSGGNISPALAWSNAPAGTKNFVITAYDPDAPTGSGFWHWSMANIPATVSALGGGLRPDGGPAGTVQVRNDYGTLGFGGACPPPGMPHRYIFTVYAMGVETLPIDASPTPAVVGFMTLANTIGKATLTALYGR